MFWLLRLAWGTCERLAVQLIGNTHTHNIRIYDIYKHIDIYICTAYIDRKTDGKKCFVVAALLAYEKSKLKFKAQSAKQKTQQQQQSKLWRDSDCVAHTPAYWSSSEATDDDDDDDNGGGDGGGNDSGSSDSDEATDNASQVFEYFVYV